MVFFVDETNKNGVIFKYRGDPDAADLMGNTALHWAVNHGHVDCVSFLVNFGVNLWSLNNDHQTSKDIAAIKSDGRKMTDILNLLDTVMARNSALNPKSVRKQKERAFIEAEKRIKEYEKLQKKAWKKIEKQEKDMEKKRSKLLLLSTSKDNRRCRFSLMSRHLRGSDDSHPNDGADLVVDHDGNSFDESLTSRTMSTTQNKSFSPPILTSVTSSSSSSSPSSPRRSSSSPGRSASRSSHVSSEMGGSISLKPMVHLFRSRNHATMERKGDGTLKISDLVNIDGSVRSGRSGRVSLSGVSRKILNRKLSHTNSLFNLSSIDDCLEDEEDDRLSSSTSNTSNHQGRLSDAEFKIREITVPDSGYFSSVRSLSGLRRDSQVLFRKKDPLHPPYDDIYQSMHSLSLRSSPWVAMFQKDSSNST